MIVWWCLACFGLGVAVGVVWAGMAGNGERMNKFKVARKATQEKRAARARRQLEALRATLGLPVAVPVVSSEPVEQGEGKAEASE